MAVRPLRDEDRAQVGAWKHELWGEDAWFDGETVLVWDEGELGGFISLSVRPWADGCETAPVPFVEGWFVAERHRRTGIGRALVRAAEDWARQQGFTELGSDALLDNAVSLRAHRRLGFQPTERSQFFRKDLTAGAPGAVTIERHEGPRGELRALFEEAEDSAAQLDAYIDDGIVLVARDREEIVGHLQLIGDELKNMAVAATHRGTGLGRRLVEAAIEHARAEGRERMVVATASADVDNLRFYQRMGFRMRSIERDVFTPQAGYAPGLEADGIPVLDRVWLDRELT